MVGLVSEKLLRCGGLQDTRVPRRGICTFQPLLTIQTQRVTLSNIRNKGCSAAYSSTMSTSEGETSTSSLMQVSAVQQQFWASPKDPLLQQAALCCYQQTLVDGMHAYTPA